MLKLFHWMIPSRLVWVIVMVWPLITGEPIAPYMSFVKPDGSFCANAVGASSRINAAASGRRNKRRGRSGRVVDCAFMSGLRGSGDAVGVVASSYCI
jgi:hypothetical protein